jgi:transcriptional regulator with GAF, ATPase, and Fis domain
VYNAAVSLKLRIEIEGRDPVAVRAGGAVVTLGRVEGNDIVVADARISSRHGRFVRRGEGYAYEDLGSRNGSLVERDGKRLVGRTQELIPVAAGTRILLGDLTAPVVLVVEEAPTASDEADPGGTVVATRALGDGPPPAPKDPATLESLFGLLRDLSGRIDPQEVLARISAAVLDRFPQARGVTVLMADAEGVFVPETTRVRASAGPAARPSDTLVRRVVDRRELVAYAAGQGAPSASVMGVAAAVLVPLVVAGEVIGVLHVDTLTGAFTPDDQAWLAIIGTHVAASLGSARRFRAMQLDRQALVAENTALKALPRPILGHSEALRETLRQLERVARTQTTVLVTGETGTGKELAARFVHAYSTRGGRVFSALNCGALPENLLESELFGHRKGAFTGAVRDHAGLFEASDGGTVFLDEIGEISPAVQVRLLRVLQEREVQPVGASRPLKVDVRIVAATNRDLKAEVAAGRFREDLYYRLAVFPVRLPALRERRGDVELLAEQFRQAAVSRHGKRVPGFTTEALAALTRYAWPGNVRQLEHEIERAVILAMDAEPIGLADLSTAVTGGTPLPTAHVTEADLPVGPLHDVMDQLERRVVARCLSDNAQNRTRAAQALGISRQALQAKLARWRDQGVPLGGEDEG